MLFFVFGNAPDLGCQKKEGIIEKDLEPGGLSCRPGAERKTAAQSGGPFVEKQKSPGRKKKYRSRSRREQSGQTACDSGDENDTDGRKKEKIQQNAIKGEFPIESEKDRNGKELGTESGSPFLIQERLKVVDACHRAKRQ